MTMHTSLCFVHYRFYILSGKSQRIIFIRIGILLQKVRPCRIQNLGGGDLFLEHEKQPKPIRLPV